MIAFTASLFARRTAPCGLVVIWYGRIGIRNTFDSGCLARIRSRIMRMAAAISSGLSQGVFWNELLVPMRTLKYFAV